MNNFPFREGIQCALISGKFRGYFLKKNLAGKFHLIIFFLYQKELCSLFKKKKRRTLRGHIYMYIDKSKMIVDDLEKEVS